VEHRNPPIPVYPSGILLSKSSLKEVDVPPFNVTLFNVTVWAIIKSELNILPFN